MRPYLTELRRGTAASAKWDIAVRVGPLNCIGLWHAREYRGHIEVYHSYRVHLCTCFTQRYWNGQKLNSTNGIAKTKVLKNTFGQLVGLARNGGNVCATQHADQSVFVSSHFLCFIAADMSCAGTLETLRECRVLRLCVVACMSRRTACR